MIFYLFGELLRRGAEALHSLPQERKLAQESLDGGDRTEHERVDDDGNSRRGQDQAVLIDVEQAEKDAGLADNEGKFTDLGQPGGHDDHRARR